MRLPVMTVSVAFREASEEAPLMLKADKVV